MTVVVGADGSGAPGPTGWVLVRLGDGQLRFAALVGSFKEVLAEVEEAGAEALAVDIPIGHDDPDGTARGGRRLADRAAKAFLGPRHASVFPVPPLSLFELDDHEAAAARAEQEGWIKPSRQVWNLGPRIREVHAAVRDHAAGDRIFEAHPEVSFQALHHQLGGGGALDHGKRDPDGVHERLELLHRAGLRPRRALGGVGRASPDDVLDATVCAWTAARIAAGEAATLPEEPPTDPETGRPVAIWY